MYFYISRAIPADITTQYEKFIKFVIQSSSHSNMTFQVIDLISQAFAIEEQFSGQSEIEILDWLQNRGTLYELQELSSEGQKIFIVLDRRS